MSDNLAFTADGDVTMGVCAAIGDEDVIIEDDVVVTSQAISRFGNKMKSAITKQHSDVYSRHSTSRRHSVTTNADQTQLKVTRRSLSRHGSKVQDSVREHDVKADNSIQDEFMISPLRNTENLRRYRSIIRASRDILAEHERITSAYSMPKETPAFCSCLATLEVARVALVTGQLGSGKTHLAYDVMLALQAQTPDCSAIILQSPFELDVLNSLQTTTIVLIDNCFGLNGLFCKYVNEYKYKLELLKRLIHRKRLYLVLISDDETVDNISDTGLEILSDLGCCTRIELDSDEFQLSTGQRKDILRSWCNRFDVAECGHTEVHGDTDDNTGTPIGYPGICQLAGIADVDALRTDAVRAIAAYLSELESVYKLQYATLLMAATKQDMMQYEEINKHQEHFDNIIEVTQLKEVKFEEAVHAVDDLVADGVIVKHAGGLQLSSRLLYLQVLKRLVEKYREHCIPLLSVTVINTIHFIEGEVFPDDMVIICQLTPTVLNSLAVNISNALESKRPDIYFEVAASNLWTTIDFINTVFSVYGYHIFLMECSDHVPLLAYLVRTGNVDAVAVVLEYIERRSHASASVSKQINMTKLEACRTDNKEILKSLMELSPSIIEEMLLAAVEDNNEDLLDSMMDKVASNGMFTLRTSLLQRACKCGTYSILQYLLRTQDTRSISAEIRKRDASGMSLLHYAAVGGAIDVYTHLEELGCDPTWRSHSRFNVLHFCSLYGNLSLLKHICSTHMHLLSETAKHGFNCAHLAAMEGHTDVLEYVFECGIDADTLADEMNTVSHIAATNGMANVLRLIYDMRSEQLTYHNSGTFLPIHLTAKCGHVEAIKCLFDNGTNPETKTVDNRTCLHLAAFYGQQELVDFLCNTYPQLKSCLDTDGNSVLHDAAAGGNRSVFEWLVKSGMDPWQMTNDGATVLHDACYYGNYEVVKYVSSKYPAMVNTLTLNGLTPIVGAALGGSPDIIDYLAKKGADINVQTNEGSALMHEAAYTGQLNVVKYLMTEYKHMQDIRNNRSFMPLHFAAQEGHQDVFTYLLPDRGNDLPLTQENQTCLHIAAYNGMINIVKLLYVKYKQLLSCVDTDGALALHYAARGGCVEVLDYIIEVGQDPEVTTDSGSTILHLAAFDGNLAMVTHICNNYPELVDFVDLTGHSSAHYAAGSGQIPVLKVILQNGVDPLSTAENGSTLLMKAAFNGKLEMARYLCTEYPELLELQDTFGCNVLHYAASGGHVTILQFGMEEGSDPMECTCDGYSILHVATYHGQMEAVSFLCHCFPELMAQKDSSGRIPVEIAKQSDNHELLRVFASKQTSKPEVSVTEDESEWLCCFGMPGCKGCKLVCGRITSGACFCRK